MSDIVPSNPPLRQCSKCPNSYPATNDYFHRNRDGLRPDCKECSKKRARTHYEEHPEYYQDYAQDHIEQINQHNKNYRKSHPEKIKQTRINAREQRRAYEQNRRARKKNAEGTYTEQDIQHQYQVQKGKCYYCHKKVGQKYHVDHIVPLSKGGSNKPDNLVIACPTCNISKKDKLLHEWAEGGRLF